MLTTSAERSRAWREANPEKARAASRRSANAWRLANPERKAAANRKWYEANKEKVNAQAKAWLASLDPEKRKALQRERVKRAYDRDPEKFRLRSAMQRAANPERVKAGYHAWHVANRDRRAETRRARDARMRNASPAWLTREQRLAMQQVYREARTLGLTVDHIVPLDGCRRCEAHGLHVPWNLQPLSFEQNSGKRNLCGDCWKE